MDFLRSLYTAESGLPPIVYRTYGDALSLKSRFEIPSAIHGKFPIFLHKLVVFSGYSGYLHH